MNTTAAITNKETIWDAFVKAIGGKRIKRMEAKSYFPEWESEHDVTPLCFDDVILMIDYDIVFSIYDLREIAIEFDIDSIENLCINEVSANHYAISFYEHDLFRWLLDITI